MRWKHFGGTIVVDYGGRGVDGRHWVKVEFDEFCGSRVKPWSWWIDGDETIDARD